MASSQLPCAAKRIQALSRSAYCLTADDVSRVMSPTLCVHLDKVRHNLAAVISHCNGDVSRWRPHVKTIKTPEIVAELAAVGVRQFKAATAHEAEMVCTTMRSHGRASECDIIIAFPHTGPQLTRLQQVARAFPEATLSVVVENADAVAQVPSELSIFVDVNPGMNRTGMPLSVAEAGGLLSVAQVIERTHSGRFRGIHFYDGHSSNWQAGHERRQALFPLYDRLLRLDADLAAHSIHSQELVTSGTPSMTSALAHKGLEQTLRHTVSPGTVVLADVVSLNQCPDVDLIPAAVLLGRVVSHPTVSSGFTIDIGSKSAAPEYPEYGLGLFVGHVFDFELQRPSEEHLPVLVTEGCRPALGSDLYLVPTHVCPTVNLAQEVLLVDMGRIVGTAEVTARAHEVLLPIEGAGGRQR